MMVELAREGGRELGGEWVLAKFGKVKVRH